MTSNYHFIDGRSGMVIVSKCPRCGAPIYAPNIWHGNEAPPVSHTCECSSLDALFAALRNLRAACHRHCDSSGELCDIFDAMVREMTHIFDKETHGN